MLIVTDMNTNKYEQFLNKALRGSEFPIKIRKFHLLFSILFLHSFLMLLYIPRWTSLPPFCNAMHVQTDNWTGTHPKHSICVDVDIHTIPYI